MLNAWANWLGMTSGPSTAKGALSPFDLATPLPSWRLRVDGLSINTIEAGPEGDTPLVFLHGLSAWMGFWQHQLEWFCRSRRVLAMDLPGFGASDAPDAPYTPSWFCERLRLWLDALQAGPVDLVGHSMGGQIALTFAATYPERVRRLVLVAPAGIETFTPMERVMMKGFWNEDRARQTTEDGVRTNMRENVFARPDDHVDALIEERVRMGLHPRFVATSRAVSRCIAGMVNEPVYHRLADIHHPSLVVFGGRDKMVPNRLLHPGLYTRQVYDEARQSLPNATGCWLDNAGHTVHHDDPAGFNRAVLRFLESSS